MYASSQLDEGEVYSRDDLRRMFDTTDATINTGIFQPAGHSSVWLFITEQKTSDRTPYNDALNADTLYWEGQTTGRKDDLIIHHERRGIELLVFYRLAKQQYEHAGFRYEGRFRYVSHSGGNPTRFVLQRVTHTQNG